jgi:formamidopyrimidine-DNA glycosylase
MTGQLIFRGAENFAGGHPTDSFFANLPDKQTRVEFGLENGKLFFNDQRKFGFVKVIETTEVENDKFIKALAKEPWDMTVDEFKQNLMRHKTQPIKATILDQKVVAGIGNIYADEALFYAKIHPKRRTESLSDEEIEKLLEGAREMMQRSIDSGGSTMKTYVKADGTRGDYLRLFAKVFRREGEPCENCGTEIIKIRVAGRGTHICPHCQKETE